MENVKSVCSYLINSSLDEGIPMSNISLQKILYFSQGLHLAETDGIPLFDDKIYAWTYGPVVKSVYHEFKFFGNNNIDLDKIRVYLGENFLNSRFELKLKEKIFVSQVWNAFKNYAAFELVQLTHANGSPWHDIYLKHNGNPPKDCEIKHKSMTTYFKQFVTSHQD